MLFVLPLKAFTAPINILSEIFSKWPRKRSHGPAIEIWSVVHLPSAFSNSGISISSLPSQAAKGFKTCKRLEPGLITTSASFPVGATYPLSFTSNPFGGKSVPSGSFSFTSRPSAVFSVSVSGLKQRSPAMVSASVSSGEATKACVFGLPSARLAKLRLKEVTMEFLRVLSSVCRFHCPIHGPQALAITVAPICSKSPRIPSRSAV